MLSSPASHQLLHQSSGCGTEGSALLKDAPAATVRTDAAGNTQQQQQQQQQQEEEKHEYQQLHLDADECAVRRDSAVSWGLHGREARVLVAAFVIDKVQDVTNEDMYFVRCVTCCSGCISTCTVEPVVAAV